MAVLLENCSSPLLLLNNSLVCCLDPDLGWASLLFLDSLLRAKVGLWLPESTVPYTQRGLLQGLLEMIWKQAGSLDVD
jgi:hypothetical protein